MSRRLRWFTLFILLLLTPILSACDEGSSTPPPSPTPRPTTTPMPTEVLGGGLYTISHGDRMIATEEVKASEFEGQLVVSSVVRYCDGIGLVERRSLVLTPLLNPMRYDLVQQTDGGRSVWVGERREDGFGCLANNADWHGPVAWSDIQPQAELMLERMPSALPFAILALRTLASDQPWGATEEMAYNTLDVLAAHPATGTLTIGLSHERESAVIGTLALSGELSHGPTETFTLWVRPDSRQLYAVELADYTFDFWQRQRCPAYTSQETVTIQRVRSLPVLETPSPASEAFSFQGLGGAERSGTLHLPKNSAPPHPCLVVHGPDGLRPPLTLDERFSKAGWGVYYYDSGDLERLQDLADDALLALRALAADERLDAERILFVGIGDSARLGGVLSQDQGSYAGTILIGGTSQEPLLPDLASHQIASPLANYYNWGAKEIETCMQATVNQWQTWLYEDQDTISQLGRKVRLDALKQAADYNATATLSQAAIPVLLLHGAEDRWIPSEGVQSLYQEVSGVADVELILVDGADHNLADATCTRLAETFQQELLAWLNQRY